ncbi:MAG: hypothetical protein WBF90_32805 [Rivularia sp. (in: cyanobacteria)]
MKIVEQTPTLLKLQKSKLSIIRSYASLLGCITFSSFFLPLGLGIFLLGSPKTLKCNRLEPTQVNCEYTSYNLFGEKATSIRQLQGAEVQVEEDSDGDTYTTFILLTKNDRIPLNKYAAHSEEGLRKEATQINDFISNPQQNSLIINHGHNWFLYILGIFIFILNGMLVIFFIRQKVTIICTFDKESGRMYLRRYGILGRETIDYTLDKIDRARVNSLSSENNYYNVQLVLISGKRISLNLQKNSYSNSNKVAKSINQFLNRNDDKADFMLMRSKILFKKKK